MQPPELDSWHRGLQAKVKELHATNAALEARLAEAERVLRSIAANSCCGDCQEAKRVAQSYFGAADRAPAVPLCECGRLDDDVYYCTKVEGYPFRCRKEEADSATAQESDAP